MLAARIPVAIVRSSMRNLPALLISIAYASLESLVSAPQAIIYLVNMHVVVVFSHIMKLQKLFTQIIGRTCQLSQQLNCYNCQSLLSNPWLSTILFSMDVARKTELLYYTMHDELYTDKTKAYKFRVACTGSRRTHSELGFNLSELASNLSPCIAVLRSPSYSITPSATTGDTSCINMSTGQYGSHAMLNELWNLKRMNSFGWCC